MDNVPVHINSPAGAGRHASGPSDAARRSAKQKKNKQLKIGAIIAAAALVLLTVVFSGWSLYQSSVGAHIDKSKYQAVFFTNGQVYFGKLERLNGGYFKLNDIFYLQAKAAKSTTKDSANPQETTNQSSDVQLIKLGSEVHGPNDEMVMSKEQILFFENLKKDSKVSDSIGQYHNRQK